MHRVIFLRFDFYLTLLLAWVLSMGTVWGVNHFIVTPLYQNYQEQTAIADGQVGGKATDSTPRAQSINDLSDSVPFTIEVDRMDYYSLGGMVAENTYWKIVELPDGERVAAQVNAESIQSDVSTDGETALLPVGLAVNTPLSSAAVAALEQVGGITQSGFYLNMGAPLISEQDFGETIRIVTQLISFALGFALVHWIGARIGLFPPIFNPRHRKTETGVDSK